jgi:hypothetical protein
VVIQGDSSVRASSPDSRPASLAPLMVGVTVVAGTLLIAAPPAIAPAESARSLRIERQGAGHVSSLPRRALLTQTDLPWPMCRPSINSTNFMTEQKVDAIFVSEMLSLMHKQLDLAQFRNITAYEIPGPGAGFVLRPAPEQYEFDGRSSPRGYRWEENSSGPPRGIVHWVKRMLDGKLRYRELHLAVSAHALELEECHSGTPRTPGVTLKPAAELSPDLLDSRLTDRFRITVLINEYERVGCCGGELVFRPTAHLSTREHLQGAGLAALLPQGPR